MTVLLDTHALIWWMERVDRLSARAKTIIGNPANRILVSAAVGWELAIKAKAGKIDPALALDDLDRALQQQAFAELAITLGHAIQAGLLPLHHRDPFDRLLVAQAQSLNVPILSADAVLDRYGVKRLW